jgi:putative transcriptional regulator
MIPGMSSTKGRLLVATPPLVDPNFDRTVVFMIEHHDEGALGVVLNRPTGEILGDPLERWSELQSEPAGVYVGGPVEPDALIALAHTSGPLPDDDEHLSALTASIASADLATDPTLMAASIGGLRVFRGYAGWGPGQLEGEIDAGAWLVVDSDPADVFTARPDDLWRTVLRRQPGRVSWLAEAPDDLSWN